MNNEYGAVLILFWSTVSLQSYT